MSNIISNNSLKNFSSTLTLFSNYIIKHNLIPTFSQNPIPELYKLHLNKIKINNYKTPPNFQFTPNNI